MAVLLVKPSRVAIPNTWQITIDHPWNVFKEPTVSTIDRYCDQLENGVCRQYLWPLSTATAGSRLPAKEVQHSSSAWNSGRVTDESTSESIIHRKIIYYLIKFDDLLAANKTPSRAFAPFIVEKWLALFVCVAVRRALRCSSATHSLANESAPVDQDERDCFGFTSSCKV